MSVAYDAAAAVAFSQKLDREAKASLAVHRYGCSLRWREQTLTQ